MKSDEDELYIQKVKLNEIYSFTIYIFYMKLFTTIFLSSQILKLKV